MTDAATRGKLGMAAAVSAFAPAEASRGDCIGRAALFYRHPGESRGPGRQASSCNPGSPEFTNEVQHLSKVLRWDRNMSTSHWRNGAGLPVFMKTGNRSAKSRQ